MKNKSLIAIIAVLVIVVAVLAYLNYSQMGDVRALAEDVSFVIKLNGDEVQVVTFEELLALEQKEFSTIKRTSSSPDSEHFYKGVPLKAVVEYVDAGLFEAGTQLISRSIDAYVVAYSMDEVKQDDNLYIVYEEDGKPLGTREEGGQGPLMIVVSQDQFAQRWSKFMVELDIQ